MITRFFVAALVLAASAIQSCAADLSAIPRAILKEPTYQGKPRYCLLVLGQTAGTRIWLVQDGTKLYVDRNGNSDLTEPGEFVLSPTGTYFVIDQLLEHAGPAYKNLCINCGFNNGTFTLVAGQERQRQQFVGIDKMERPSWGATPATAPIIHLGGAMTLERYGPIYTLPRGAGDYPQHRFCLRLMVGTPGLGKGTFASYDEICSENLGLIQADIEYKAKAPGDPVKQRIELLHDG
jgi:hypothetical protein